MKAEKQIVLMDRARIRRTLKRIVFQIAENTHGKQVILVGLNDRGGVVAGEMAGYLEKALSQPVDLLTINLEDGNILPIGTQQDLEGKFIVLVDDVIFSGHTMFSALRRLPEGCDCTVSTAVLVDRGHRTVPILAGFIGMEIPTKANEHVELDVKNNRAETVYLYKTV
ncbi:MAG: phosphoribosyltransferase family protein [Balneolaceae bacterium]